MLDQTVIQTLIEKVESVTKEHAAKRVIKVHISIGALYPVAPEILKEQLLKYSADTVIQDAEIDINKGADVTDLNARDILLKSVELEQ